MSAVMVDAETGEVRDVKSEATEAATALLEVVWSDTQRQYNVGPLTALDIAKKIVAAVLTGAVAEHAKVLAEEFRPQQQRMEM